MHTSRSRTSGNDRANLRRSELRHGAADLSSARVEVFLSGFGVSRRLSPFRLLVRRSGQANMASVVPDARPVALSHLGLVVGDVPRQAIRRNPRRSDRCRDCLQLPGCVVVAASPRDRPRMERFGAAEVHERPGGLLPVGQQPPGSGARTTTAGAGAARRDGPGSQRSNWRKVRPSGPNASLRSSRPGNASVWKQLRWGHRFPNPLHTSLHTWRACGRSLSRAQCI
jgi:hypothetical protein